MATWYDVLFPGPTKIESFQYQYLSQQDCDADETVELKKLKNIPYYLNPYIFPNAALFLSYFNVGIAIYLMTTPLSVYLINTLDVSSIKYNAYVTMISLPWSLKFIFGTLSDSVSIVGYRRKSWLLIGWCIFIALAFYLASVARPSFPVVASITFIMTCSFLLSDVVNDAMCVQRARAEYEENKGAIQTVAYTIRSYGCVIGAILGTVLYNTDNWGWGLTISQLFLLSALIPLLTLIPTMWNVEEITGTRPIPSVLEVIKDIWNTLQLRAVWYPMIFIYTYSVFQIPNSAWTNFLILGILS
jgi:MFS family permease